MSTQHLYTFWLLAPDFSLNSCLKNKTMQFANATRRKQYLIKKKQKKQTLKYLNCKTYVQRVIAKHPKEEKKD